jgi:hypothetical protein
VANITTLLQEIAAALGKSEADVAQYTAAFFKLGPTHIDPVDWERWLSRIDKGEKRVRFSTLIPQLLIHLLVLVVVVFACRVSLQTELLSALRVGALSTVAPSSYRCCSYL